MTGVDFDQLSPMERAMQSPPSWGSNDGFSFFNIKDGESKYVRFLYGPYPVVVVSHKCGLPLTEIRQRDWDAQTDAGQPHLCPMCGDPLSENDVAYHRPAIPTAMVHRYQQVADQNNSDKRSNFVCLSHSENVKAGLVISADCPICHGRDDNKDTRARERYYCPLLERDIQFGGMMYPDGVTRHGALAIPTDVLENGIPKIAVWDGGFHKSIYETVLTAAGLPENWCLYDYKVTRTGKGIDTVYTIQRIDILGEQGTTAIAIDLRNYEQYMPDIQGYLKNIGTHQFYASKGYPVAGYVPPPATPSTATTQFAQQVQQMGLPQQPVPQPQQPAAQSFIPVPQIAQPQPQTTVSAQQTVPQQQTTPFIPQPQAQPEPQIPPQPQQQQQIGDITTLDWSS